MSQTLDTARDRWCNILLAATGVTSFIALFMFLPPHVSISFFNVLLYGGPAFPEAISEEGTRYLMFTYGVMGCIMIGWMVLMAWLIHGPLRSGSLMAWKMAVASLVLWYISDSLISIIFDYWQNALSNTALSMLFLFPLLRIKPHLSN